MKNISAKTIVIFGILIFLAACSSTKYVPENKYLLKRVNIKVDDKRIAKSEAKVYLKQKPNSRTLSLLPFYLWVYNLSGADSTKKVNKFLRNFGEAPVIYDSIQTQRTIVQLQRFMENKGFYDAEVSKKEVFGARKVAVDYIINAKEPKIVDKFFLEKDSLNSEAVGWQNLKIEVEDSTALRKILLEGKDKTEIEKGDLLDVDKLKLERERLEKLYKSKGYYSFDEDNIHFYLDTTRADNKAYVYCGLRTEDSLKLRKYKIDKVVVSLDIDGRNNLGELRFDSTEYKTIKFLHKGKISYKPEVLTKAIILREGQFYNPQNVEETKERLGILQQFRYSNISFSELPTVDSVGKLLCSIQLISRKRQSYGVESTVTYHSGNLGFVNSLRYQHKNLFRGAELFAIELSAGVERMKDLNSEENFNAKEFGGSMSLTTPKFFLPFLKAKGWRAKVPRTKFSMIYNYAERPEYTRTITDLMFSYQWKSSRFFSHVLTPIDLGLLKVNADEAFLNRLNSYYRETSYVDHIIPSFRYGFVFNNQGKTRKTTYQRVRFGLETAGNLLSSIDHLNNRGKGEKDVTQKEFYSHFGIRYAQFVRSDIEFTYSQFINPKHALIYHTFIGLGYPYGNSNVMPFEKMYFAGGANSMRAWQPRSLGPGASRANEPNQRLSYGEMKLEGNIEYRFAFGKNVEGALFVDAGNVWNISEMGNRDAEGRFEWDNFYKQIAVGSGLGFRYNISNIILRLDAGVKVIDPYLDGNTLVKNYKLKDITLNFGIGYPF